MARLVIRQFGVYSRSGRLRAGDAPFVVVLQSHFVELSTVVVAPLLDTPRDRDVSKLTVRVEVNDAEYGLYVAELAAVPRNVLREQVGDASALEDDIRRALERLFSGF